MLVKDRLRNTD